MCYLFVIQVFCRAQYVWYSEVSTQCLCEVNLRIMLLVVLVFVLWSVIIRKILCICVITICHKGEVRHMWPIITI